MDRRILIAEDSKLTCEQLRTLLQGEGQLTVDAVGDGQAALQALAQHNYSILLTDLQMPHLDGMHLIERIQEKQLPVTVIVEINSRRAPSTALELTSQPAKVAELFKRFSSGTLS